MQTQILTIIERPVDSAITAVICNLPTSLYLNKNSTSMTKGMATSVGATSSWEDTLYSCPPSPATESPSCDSGTVDTPLVERRVISGVEGEPASLSDVAWLRDSE